MHDYLFQKMKEGWNFNVECKGKGRGYELSYEALSSKDNDWGTSKHAVGDTFIECMSNLFNEPLENDRMDEPLKKYMMEAWNLDLGFNLENNFVRVRGHAKQICGDYDLEKASHRCADGASVEEVLANLFEHYDPQNPYAAEFAAKMEIWKGRK